MNIGVPKERRSFEYRVGLSPVGIQMLSQCHHTCYVEHDAGIGAGFSDLEYEQAGAKIVYSPHEVFGRADLLLKVTRPLSEEIDWLRPGTTLAGLLHLGSARQEKITQLKEKKITAISYENIRLANGSVPIRRPLSQIGGRLVAQIAAHLLQNNAGGKGILIGGVAGVPPAEIVIIGAGIAGTCATQSFLGMGAHVTVLDDNIDALNKIFDSTQGIVTMVSNPINITRACSYADVVVGAILVPGKRPPIVVTREMIQHMKPRSIVMDISIDEGGCIETSRPTNHEQSTFIEHGVIHYCVPNIPSAVARTSTHAFLNAAYRFINELANKGSDAAIKDNPAIERGVAIHNGELKHITRLMPKPLE
jgi:alanine dehydrogenase